MLRTYSNFYGMPRFPLQKVVNNKTKRQILKRVLQENEARQIFRKTKISYPLIRTCPFLIPWYAHGRVRIREKEMFVFRKIWRALFSWNSRFKIRPFALLPTNRGLVWSIIKICRCVVIYSWNYFDIFNKRQNAGDAN